MLPICPSCASKSEHNGEYAALRTPRRITIVGDDTYTRDYQACERCHNYLTDSEILHDFLCIVDPGDTYSVSFVTIPVA